MPLSKEAAEGLRAAVEYHPAAARSLLDILRFLPLGVRYKEQDRYSPLAFMISAIPHTLHVTKMVHLPVKKISPFPQEKLRFCEIFQQEWLERRFTKQELAVTIEYLLDEIEPRPLIEDGTDTATVVVTKEGTFLAESFYEKEMKHRIDPE